MKLVKLGFVLLGATAIQVEIRAQSSGGGAQPAPEIFSGATEHGVPFPLPQETFSSSNPRRTQEGETNALTISWDGRLLMYVDYGASLWSGAPARTNPWGFVFATFDPSRVTLDAQGRPNFSGASPSLSPFGTPFPRFAEVKDTAPPDTSGHNTYPNYSGLPGAYPWIVGSQGDYGAGSMGELGLKRHEVLSDNMYPVPTDELPAGAYNHNPFRSAVDGTADVGGQYLTYRAYVTFQDLTQFWVTDTNDPAYHKWSGYRLTASGHDFEYLTYYPPGTYPNGLSVDAQHGPDAAKRNGSSKLEITVDPTAHLVKRVAVLQKWKPFQVIGDGTWTDQPAMASVVGLGLPTTSTMWADTFEPVLTQDGHLLVGKARPGLVTGSGPTRVVFFYNQTAFGESGWEGPWELTKLYSKRDVVIAGIKLGERYPLARHRLKDYDGHELADDDPFEGGYTWIDPDGRFLIYTIDSAGVGVGHPETALAADGGGSSNRASPSIIGSVTGWQSWRIDHEAENPSRHMFTGWDQDSRTTHQRVASFGFGPGFWDVLRGSAGLPLRDDGHVKLQLVNSQRLLYYELDLTPYQERDYGFYLPMTEMLALRPGAQPNDPPGPGREVDLTRTPDLSGHGHFAYVEGGQLPCEYFELPAQINPVAPLPGLYASTLNYQDIGPNWQASDAIAVQVGPTGSTHTEYWAPIADWKDGKDSNRDHVPDTAPFSGRGALHDMDSDACWGRVGQAMLFKQSTRVRVDNSNTPVELNPGPHNGARAFTASMWVHPRQPRTADTALITHNFTISLKQNGAIEAALAGYTLTSGANAAPLSTWTHVALTWKDTTPANESEMRLYIDGVEVAFTTMAQDVLAKNTQDIYIGCLASCASDPNIAVLLLDEVALKNTALAGQDMVNLALGPIPHKTWDHSTTLPPTPIPFDNATDSRIPTTNAYNDDVAQLGADLFRDVQLSGNKTMSCASCHVPAQAFTDGLATPGVNLIRNTPTIYNQRFQVEQFWDARAVDLEDQVVSPIISSLEMNNTVSNVLSYLSNDTDYVNRFTNLFTDPLDPGVSVGNLRKALATFERSMTAGDAPADEYNQGNTSALSAAEKRGRGLFLGKARCSGCHNGPNLTDGRLWTTGTFRTNDFDNGAFNANASPNTAGRERFRGAFKTPTLRELARTGPYFHDGSVTSLSAVVDFYDAGGVRPDSLGYALDQPGHDSVAEEINHKLGLSSTERSDLVAYLNALAAGSSGINDGPAGLNHAPTVTISSVTPNSPPGSVTVVATVKEPLDGAGDLDTNMNWTLELTLTSGGTVYHWSDAAAVVPVTNGYRLSLVEPSPSSLTVQLRAADHHGKWSGWIQY